jgi:hypothetical protein
MLGSLLSGVIDVASAPLKIGNAILDVASGGDGSRESRQEIPLSGDLEEIVEDVEDWLEDEL